MYIELVAQLSLIHYHKWVVQQVKMCIKDYTYKTLTSFGCLQFIITLWLPFCNINNDREEEAGSVIQSKFVQCVVWSSNFILMATRHLLSLMLHAVTEKKQTPHLRKFVTCDTVANLYFSKISLLSLVYWWQIYFMYWFFFFFPQMGLLSQVLLKRCWKVYFTCVLDKVPCKGWHLLWCDL